MTHDIPPASRPHDVLFIVNSVFGARKAPGFRPWQLVRFEFLHPRVVARGAAAPYAPIHFPLPGRSLIPRGLNFLRIKFFPKLPARDIEQNLFDRLCARLSKKLKERPRAAHLWDHLTRTAAYWHAQGVPVLIDLHMAHPRCYQHLIESGRVDPAIVGSLEDPAADACVAMADVLVCPSVFVRDSLPEIARRRAVVIPFGADPVVTTPKSAAAEPRPVRVLFAGNVNFRKGITFVIEAWRRLPPEIAAKAELVVCGRLFRQMDALVATAPAGVRFVGFQADMSTWFADADIFVLPSLMEGSAKAVYEAMAWGLPPIVSPHTGSVVQDGEDGLIVPPADPDALGAALARLIENPDQRTRIGEAARKTAAAHTWDVYARGVAALYEKFPAPAVVPPRFADTYDEHMAPRPLKWKARRALEQARVVVQARGRTIGGASDSRWLRFPYYHHVFSDERRGFARHMDEMRRYGEFISLDQAVSLLESGAPIDGRYFCLTFDDGFRNTLSNGLPILMERNIPAAVFVVSDLIVDRAGDHTAEHDRFFGPHRRPATFLTWEDCRILIESGVTIGSHSARHRRFVALSDEEAEQELGASKKRIEERLGVSCDHFCCPWGKPGRDFVTERETALARRLGYRSFLTTSWGHMSGGESPYAIRRVGLLARRGLAQLRYFLSL